MISAHTFAYISLDGRHDTTGSRSNTHRVWVSCGRLGTVNALRDEFSRLEREFVELKIFIEDQSEQNTNELDSSVIQDKIKQFDSTLKVRMKTDDGKLLSQQQEIDELRTEITRLNKVNNKLQDQKACISKNLASMENSN